MADKLDEVIKKLEEIGKRLADLESYVYSVDDFLPARSLIEKAIGYIEKKETVNAEDLEKRFRITHLRAQKLITLFTDYGLLHKETDTDGSHKINKEGFYQFDISSPVIFSGDEDKLVEAATKIVQEHDKASASLLQRRLSLGYVRAAYILDRLEAMGIVGPAVGAKPREVLKK